MNEASRINHVSTQNSRVLSFWFCPILLMLLNNAVRSMWHEMTQSGISPEMRSITT